MSSPTRRKVGDTLDMWQRFEVERYLEYHGTKLARRFDTNSYLAISKAMDLHDVARGRGALAARDGRVCAPDPGGRHLERHALPGVPAASDRRHGRRRSVAVAEYLEIDSPHGHDAFLINGDQLAGPLERFLANASKSDL